MSTIKANQWLSSDGTENYKCKAFVNFNGTGTVAIRASGNVSSITDNGVGDYTVNFTTAMIDANYCVSTSSHQTNFTSGTNSGYGGGCGVKYLSTCSTTSVGVYHSTVNNSSTASSVVTVADTDSFNVAIFR